MPGKISLQPLLIDSILFPASLKIRSQMCFRSPINGSVYIVVPGRFLLFRAPRDDLTKGAQWVDTRGSRDFSTGFFADLFDDLGVAQVNGGFTEAVSH